MPEIMMCTLVKSLKRKRKFMYKRETKNFTSVQKWQTLLENEKKKSNVRAELQLD